MSTERIEPNRPLEVGQPSSLSKTPSQFSSYMERGPASPPPNQPLPSPNPAQTVSSPPTFDTILGQAKTAQDTLGTTGQQLNRLKSQNVKLKRSQGHLLRNKLQDANEYIRSAGGKLGVETEPLQTPPGASALDRFIAYVNDGQDQLNAVQQKLKELAGSSEQLRPADMLLVQIKLNQAQQQIDYSTTLLGKVMDSIKTILNTQL